MGFGDSFKDAADKALDKLGPDKVKEGIEKVGDAIDKKTGGKYSSQVDKGQKAASDYAEKRGDKSEQ